MRYAFLLLTSLFLSLLLTSEASAQERDGWWAPILSGDDDVRVVIGERDTDRRRRRGDRRDRSTWEHRRDRDPRHRQRDRRRGAPAFCRSGEGHPVHGRRWCIDKGFGLGSRSYQQRGSRWEQHRWDDVILSRRLLQRRDVLDARALNDVLGRRALQRLVRHQRDRHGTRAPLRGRFVTTRRDALVLQVRAGRLPLAEFVDHDRDRRVDVVLLRRPR